MSAQVLGACYFLHVPPHLEHINRGSSRDFQYCEWKSFLLQHLRFIPRHSLVSTGGCRLERGHMSTKGNEINISAVLF